MVKFFYYPNLNLFQIFATILWSIKKKPILKKPVILLYLYAEKTIQAVPRKKP